MIGDQYQVFYHLDGKTYCQGMPLDTWKEAKALRGNVFDQNPRVRAAWVMRSNPSLELRQDRYGHTLRRTKHEIPQEELCHAE